MLLSFPQVEALPLLRYAPLLGPRMALVMARAAELRAKLSGRVVWNVSSSAVGGGVAEMVRSLLAYARGAGVDARWVVIEGTPEFFHITKRIHNALHGDPGDGSPLGEAEHGLYADLTSEYAAELGPMVRPGDVVIVHDPQPAGMIPDLARLGAQVIWRCHIGADHTNEETRAGWHFLLPALLHARAYVFSRAAYRPTWLEASRTVIIPPCIDPFSAKNQAMDDQTVQGILVRTGLVAGSDGDDAERCLFTREDGTPARVDRRAEVVASAPLPSLATPLVVQVSRWDRLKDPVGVLRGFADIGPAAARGACLMLVGPNATSVADDLEGLEVYHSVLQAWQELPPKVRARVYLVSLPTEDVEENAAIVNALQRHAAVIAQKSLQEGFGLTVTEALWKARPVVASAVGGIQDQIDDGAQGLLVEDPSDLATFARLIARLLADPALCRRLGEGGYERVLDRYLGVDSLLRFGALIERLDSATTAFELGASRQ